MPSTTDQQAGCVSPALTSWVDVSPDSDFPIQNLPYGVFQRGTSAPAVGIAIGDRVLDLSALHEAGLFRDTSLADTNVFARDCLNDFMATGRAAWTEARTRISSLLSSDNATLRDDDALRAKALIPAIDVKMLLPARIGDFTDFYASKYHATNVGTMFRGKDNALMPNWLHLPVGYHGRSSTVFVSGVDIRRPKGQRKADEADMPSHGPTRLLDFELEMGFFIGTGNEPGQPVSTEEAPNRIFGMVLVNDWSARDIQKWEYVPLGPFLGKSFGTSISPWVVTLDALEPYRIPGPVQEPKVLEYLQVDGDRAYDIKLEAYVQSAKMSEPMRLTVTNFKHMYWNIAQMLAHHTSNGTAMRTGDLCGSGTISGPTEDSYGCMLELCWKGTKPIKLPDGSERKFFADGDTVILKGHCDGNGPRIGFGEVRATILPAHD
ncbi:MAG: fumarylacetoacetase [Planctomycetes bacterium]|nr:fumarylacetoacetase [Planctomycetota bacterium]